LAYAWENGNVLKHIPTVRPVKDKDTMLIHMPKFKAHNLGVLTLSTKGLQGAIRRDMEVFAADWRDVKI